MGGIGHRLGGECVEAVGRHAHRAQVLRHAQPLVERGEPRRHVLPGRYENLRVPVLWALAIVKLQNAICALNAQGS